MFTGYLNLSNGTPQAAQLKGQFATLNCIALFIMIYSLLNDYKGFSKIIYVLIVLTCSIILIGVGSRMYVLVPMISFLIFKLYYAKKKWTVFKFFAISLICLAFLIMVGVWRLQDFTLNFEDYFFIFIGEPVLTWWSASTFLANNPVLHAIDFPSPYLSSFINFLPSFLFPNKEFLLIPLSEKHYFSAPLGATSAFVSIQGNFGWLLGFMFMFLFGLFFSLLENYGTKNKFILTYYILIVSTLPFQFFRDDFTISNKQWTWNMLIVPLTMVIILKFMKIVARKTQ